jgi:hypothetical protein
MVRTRVRDVGSTLREGITKKSDDIGEPQTRGVFRPRQTRQLPRAVEYKGAASKLSKLLIK